MRSSRISMALLLASLLLPPVGGTAQGQVPGDGAPYETRAELREREVELERRIATAADAQRLRQELTRVRARLENGDFRPGDAVEIQVPGSDTLSGTFQIESAGRLRIPIIGYVDLSGVLYAEADSVLRAEMSRYVRSGGIQVRPLKRVAVLGAVGSPGYYDVVPSITLSDLLMKAGGPTQSSNLDKLEIRRNGETLASAEGGLRESATLAELGLERGDQIRVPAVRGGQGGGWRTVLTVVGAVSSLAFAATRIF